ncbi:phage tail protein [Paraburkholderia sediminicola]|uniref:phage tail protein n=1 Tax=Paraburkholderia sediminicola TaxID=458836 RepID=UPI0038B6DD1D
MFKLDIKTNGKQIEASFANVLAEHRKAVVRALNKTVEQARTAASVEVRAAGYNLKASAIRKSFSIKRATNSNLVATLKATGQPIALINYGARASKRGGVTVNVKTGSTVLRHAFIATMPNGHRGVFQRVGNGHKKVVRNGKTVRTGLPIKELFGPSIPTALGNDVVEKAIMKKIREKYPQILAHEIAFLSMKK